MGDRPTIWQSSGSAAWQRTPTWLRVALAVVAGFILLRACTGGVGDDEAAGTSGSVTASTETAASEATTTTVASAPVPLRGLTTAGITGDLAPEGWECGPAADQPAPGYVKWRCARAASGSSLTIFATPDDLPVFLEMTVYFESDHRFLEQLAALPWTGAEPAAARAWVQRVTGGREVEPYQDRFGDVPFAMSGQTRTRPQWQLDVGGRPPGA